MLVFIFNFQRFIYDFRSLSQPQSEFHHEVVEGEIPPKMREDLSHLIITNARESSKLAKAQMTKKYWDAIQLLLLAKQALLYCFC